MKKKFFIWTLLFCFLLTLVALANLDTNEIIPGVSVGGLKLGTSLQDVKAKMGEPDKIQEGEGGQKYITYDYDKEAEKEYGLLLTIEDERVVSIFVYGDNFVAPGDIKVGVSSEIVMEKYKDQVDNGYYLMAENDLEGLNIIFPRKGIGFMVKEDKGEKDELVTNIMILEAIPDWTP